jgi:hypothetical protein
LISYKIFIIVKRVTGLLKKGKDKMDTSCPDCKREGRHTRLKKVEYENGGVYLECPVKGLEHAWICITKPQNKIKSNPK